VADAPAPAAADPADLRTSFRTRLEELDGRLHEVGSLAAARALARELVGDGTVARWRDATLDEIAGAEAPAEQADVSLVAGDVAVADTGAIGFAHGAGRDRAGGLLPSRQIALVPASALVATVAEALGRWFGGGRPPANVVFMAGPSRTADIEQRIIRGVHAPRELDVILFDD